MNALVVTSVCLLFISPSSAAAVALPPVTGVRLDSTVTPEASAFRFTYRISNEAGSHALDRFAIDLRSDVTRAVVGIAGLDDSATITQLTADHRSAFGDALVGVTFPAVPLRWRVVVDARAQALWHGRGSGAASPGSAKNGFVLLSRALPGIRRAQLEPDRWDDMAAAEEAAEQAGADVSPEEMIAALNASAYRQDIVGPVAPPRDATALGFLAEIEALRIRSRELGWIRTDPASASLASKSVALSAALSSGSLVEAKRVATSFIREVTDAGCSGFDCPPSKTLTSEGYALMRFNMEYLRSLVPNAPPDCTAAVASPQLFWPPNHEMVDVSVVGVTDPDGDQVAIVFDSVTQDEGVRAPGSGNFCPDAEILASGLRVRAERAGRLNGRVYRVRFHALDDAESSCQGTVRVCMPHEESTTPTCIEEAETHDSVVCP